MFLILQFEDPMSPGSVVYVALLYPGVSYPQVWLWLPTTVLAIEAPADHVHFHHPTTLTPANRKVTGNFGGEGGI